MIISKDKYWKSVRKEEQSKNLFLIYLDEVCLKSDKGHKLKLSEQLANEVVREWSADGKLSAIKNSFFTKFCFSAHILQLNENYQARLSIFLLC